MKSSWKQTEVMHAWTALELKLFDIYKFVKQRNKT